MWVVWADLEAEDKSSSSVKALIRTNDELEGEKVIRVWELGVARLG